MADIFRIERPPAGMLSVAAIDGDAMGYCYGFDISNPNLLAELYEMADMIYKHVTEQKSELCQK